MQKNQKLVLASLLSISLITLIISFFNKSDTPISSNSSLSREDKSLSKSGHLSNSIKEDGGHHHHHHHGHNHGHFGHDDPGKTSFSQKDAGENYLFSNSRIGELLEVHISRIEDIGPDADRLLEERLKEIKKDISKAGEELRSAYTKLDSNDYSNRYKLIWTLGEINDPSSAEFLSEIAVSPVNDAVAPYQGHGDINRPGLESNIRMVAIRGVASLGEATGEKEKSQEVLIQAILSADNFAVKKVGIVTFLNSSNDLDSSIDYLKSILPESEHHLITVEVQDVPELD